MARRRSAQPPLAALRSRFDAQGFVVLEPWLSPAELAVMRAECDAAVQAAAAAAVLLPGKGAQGGAWEARHRGCVFELPAACGAEHARDAAAFRVRPLVLFANNSRPQLKASSRSATAQARRGAAACRLLFGARMRRLAAALLRPARRGRAAGDSAEARLQRASLSPCLFNEQFIVKPPHSGPLAAFEWHRDGAWCHAQARTRSLAHGISASASRAASAAQATPQPRYISVWVALDDMSEENGARTASKD